MVKFIYKERLEKGLIEVVSWFSILLLNHCFSYVFLYQYNPLRTETKLKSKLLLKEPLDLFLLHTDPFT